MMRMKPILLVIMSAYHDTWRVILGLLALSAYCVLPHAAHAEIYKFIKDGVIHYTDRPPAKAAYNTVSSSPTAGSSASKKTRIGQTSSSTTQKYSDIIARVSATYGISPGLVNAVIKVESNHNARAVSPKGARGLMQLMPPTAKRFGVSDSFDPEDNVTGGVKYLRFLFKEFGEENLDLVLAGYNAGEQAVKKYDNQIPPYTETKNYVKKVLALYSPTAAAIPYKLTSTSGIYRYVNPDGTVTFTNVRRVN